MNIKSFELFIPKSIEFFLLRREIIVVIVAIIVIVEIVFVKIIVNFEYYNHPFRSAIFLLK